MNQSVPRCATEIERFETFAKVTLTAPDGKTLVTTMDKFVLPSDPRIATLERQMFHVPASRRARA